MKRESFLMEINAYFQLVAGCFVLNRSCEKSDQIKKSSLILRSGSRFSVPKLRDLRGQGLSIAARTGSLL